MNKAKNLEQLTKKLIKEGSRRLKLPPEPIEFTTNNDANKLLNDIDNFPHAFVFACIMDRQMKAEKAWVIPYILKQRLGSLDFPTLAQMQKKSLSQNILTAMSEPEPLHRFPTIMTENLTAAIYHIRDQYNNDASQIWKDKPSSATIVRRFLEFRGVGQKIATMAVNILVRDFRIDVKDRYSIDISVDVHIKRVFARMGFVSEKATNDYVIFRARELHPEYPGIFDFELWEIGRNICRPEKPICEKCCYAEFCAYRNQCGAP